MLILLFEHLPFQSIGVCSKVLAVTDPVFLTPTSEAFVARLVVAGYRIVLRVWICLFNIVGSRDGFLGISLC
jgi:hypothetical protein